MKPIMQATSTTKQYIFEAHPKKKGICPACNSRDTFRYYEGLPREYGICDRENNCGYHNKPHGNMVDYSAPIEKQQLNIIYPKVEYCNSILDNQSSNFHLFCMDKLKIPAEHLKKWKVGTKENDTAFLYQTTTTQYVNAVFIEYGTDCKRNKKKFPYSLKSNNNTEKYSLCLFGEQLLSPVTENKTVCLVESEKTACIASFFYPQFDWLATGGNNKLTGEKIHVLYNRRVFYVNDADKAGKENSTIKRLAEYKQNFQIVNLFPDRNDGYDLADAIIDGIFPDIKYAIPASAIATVNDDNNPAKENAVKEINEKKISLFAKVEQYLNELYDIRYNEISNEIEYKQKEDLDFKPLNENTIYRVLQHNNIKFSMANLLALLRSDFVKVHNPFKDYFDSLPKWNAQTDIDHIEKLSTYIQAKEPERFKTHFKKMLVRSIACALTNGVFNKQAFILVHDKQNSGKSTFCRWLCPTKLKNYYAENISIDKDSLISLSENIFINLDELATLSKVELNTLKSMFSKDYIKIRRPFERKPCVSPRRANFIGSTNKTEFLTDETGSVRWLCFDIDGINWDYQNDMDIDKVWSQAYSLFKDDFKYQLNEDEVRENETVNKDFQISTPEMELVQQNYLPANKEKHEVFYTTSELLQNLTAKYVHVKLNTVNLGKALKILGFDKGQKFIGTYQVKGYYINFLRE
jgi:predicted P-loop ATPase/Zn ribbon nucleic-acid-binding protein